LAEMIDQYCASWCEDDPARRAELLQEVWAERATYTDPLAHVEGRQNLVAHIGAMRQQFPGAKIVRTSAIDRHNHCARFGWKLEQPNGPSLPENIDIAEFRDGKLQSIIGFFGALKPK
jgi:SnoaL-like domain